MGYSDISEFAYDRSVHVLVGAASLFRLGSTAWVVVFGYLW